MTSRELRVVPAVGGETRRAFIRLPWGLYRDDPFWVPPLLADVRKALDPDAHPFHLHSEVLPYLALRGDRPVGRICAIHNRRHVEFHGEPVGFFGFFESEPDEAVAAALVEAAAVWLRERGLETVRGPASFSTNEQAGLLVEGFDGPPAILMPYNPPWYRDLLEAVGFRKAKDLLAYRMVDRGDFLPERLVRASEAIRRRTGVGVRELRMSTFEEELAVVRRIYNRSWERNWGFVPMTDEELSFMARELRPVVDPELTLFAETAEGEPVGFVLGLPDFNEVLRHLNGRLFPFGWAKALRHRRRIRRMRVVTLGVLPEHRGRGIDALLYTALIRNGLEKGIGEAEQSWVLEDNDLMRRPLERLDGRVYRRYRLFDRPA